MRQPSLLQDHIQARPTLGRGKPDLAQAPCKPAHTYLLHDILRTTLKPEPESELHTSSRPTPVVYQANQASSNELRWIPSAFLAFHASRVTKSHMTKMTITSIQLRRVRQDGSRQFRKFAESQQDGLKRMKRGGRELDEKAWRNSRDDDQSLDDVTPSEGVPYVPTRGPVRERGQGRVSDQEQQLRRSTQYESELDQPSIRLGI